MKGNNLWAETHLACATTALSDRLYESTRQLALRHFEKYFQGKNHNPWDKARVLACVHSMLKPDTSHDVMATIFDTAEGKYSYIRGRELRSLLSATAAVWAPQTTQDKPNRALENAKNATKAALDDLKISPNSRWATYTARPIVSLVTRLPASDSLKALEDILDTVAKWPVAADPDIVLILAQAVEIVAGKYKKREIPNEFDTLIQKAKDDTETLHGG